MKITQMTIKRNGMLVVSDAVVDDGTDEMRVEFDTAEGPSWVLFKSKDGAALFTMTLDDVDTFCEALQGMLHEAYTPFPITASVECPFCGTTLHDRTALKDHLVSAKACVPFNTIKVPRNAKTPPVRRVFGV